MRLIDADALLLRIDCHGTNKFGMLDEDIREYISKQPTIDPEIVQPQWIPVTEKLPHNDDFVMVIVSGKAGNITLENSIQLASFSTNDGWILEMWPEWEDPKVTHWMPLPEPYTAKVEDDDNARQVKPLEFDRFKNDTLKDAQPTAPAHWEKADIPLPYQMRTVPTPSGTVAHREMYVCSACEGECNENTRFCPHCGARMDRKDGNG